MCNENDDPSWHCEATVEVYNDLLQNSGGDEKDIIELEGGAGRRYLERTSLTSGGSSTIIPFLLIIRAEIDDENADCEAHRCVDRYFRTDLND